MAARRPSVGLDFGTSTTLVANARGVVPIAKEGTHPWMPSLVGYADDGSVALAERAETLRDGQLIRSIKRTITDNREHVRARLPIGEYEVLADELILELLREAGRRGARGGQDLGGGGFVRLGCPAMWDGRQRRRLLTAAVRADLPVSLGTMVDEPVAAGIAWLVHHRPDTDRPLRIVVFDMGGGTLDIAVLNVRDKAVSVLAALGAAEAGDALDNAIASDIESELAVAGLRVDAMPDPVGVRTLLTSEARVTKEILSGASEHVMVLSSRLFGRTHELWYDRQRLNEVFTPQMERAEESVDLALRVARITENARLAHQIAEMPTDELTNGVDYVLLSGGMSRIPYVKQRMTTLFGSSTQVESALAAPEEAVVIGLAKAGEYGKINMLRPPFDLHLEWNRGREFRVLYEAFTPLVGRGQIAGGSGELRYVRRARDLALPGEGKGKLRVISHSGQRLRASLDGRKLDGFPVTFGPGRFELSIYPDGRLRLIDGGGFHDGRIEDWHHVDAG
jgi:molecular chaperone DnaK (HSP70)